MPKIFVEPKLTSNKERFFRFTREHRFISFSIGLFILILIFMLFFKNPKTKIIEVNIPKGSNSKEITQILKKHKIIKYKTPFYLYLKFKGYDKNLRAGSFDLSPNYSKKRLARILQEKEGAASLTSITIPEGYTIIEISEKLENKGIISDQKSFINYVNKLGRDELKFEFAFLAQIPTSNLEGYLFPDTYVFAKGISEKIVLSKFLEGFQKNILPIWQSKTHPMGLHKILTLASLIEKEAYVKKELPIISGVYHNRLRKRMILASCPTVGYAMGQPRKKLLTYKDLTYKSIYNTYLRIGLPPTPIASPGIKAFKAALKPKKTRFLYFVAKGDGSHIFSTNLKNHLKSQNEILSKQKKL